MTGGPLGNPYVGLRPFFTEDSRVFFGRDEQVSELLEILHRHRFLPVVGGSGSGKSSLVRAGLIPKLRAGFLVGDRDRWQVATCRPGSAPILNFATELAGALGAPEALAGEEGLEASLRISLASGALEFIAQHLAANTSLLILVDQFEELFAFRGSAADDEAETIPTDTRDWRRGPPGDATLRAKHRAEAADFVDLLLGIAKDRDLPVFVALTMRSDFLGDCDVFQGLPEALNRASYLVPRLSREQLRQAIEGPALMAGAELSARLLDRLLNDLGDRTDRLPVLQHALRRTYEVWQETGRGGAIDLEHFETAGGLAQALERDAELALGTVNAASAEAVFRALTDTDISQRRVRRPCRMNELASAGGVSRTEVERVVAAFKGGGRNFLVLNPDGDPANPRVDISHESLIRQWPRLAGWVDAERHARSVFRQLVSTARAFRAGERDLMGEREFAVQIRQWEQIGATAEWAARYSAHLDDYEVTKAFVEDSGKAIEAAREERKRIEARAAWELQRKRRARVVGTTLLVLLLSAGLAYVNRENRIRKQAIADAGAVVGFVSRINAALEPIAGTGDVRRELLDNSEGLKARLGVGTAGGVRVPGTEFWERLQRGDIARRAAQFDSARTLYEGALATAEREGRSGNRVWRRNLMIGYQSLGDLARAAGAVDSARVWFEAAVEVADRLANEDPADRQARRDLAVTWSSLGDILRDGGQFPEARAAYGKALTITEGLAAQGTPERQRDLFASYRSLGDLEKSAGQLDSADTRYRAALAIAERLNRADPDNPQGLADLSAAYSSLGDIQKEAESFDSARVLNEKALEFALSLTADPGAHLTRSYTKLGDLEWAAGDLLKAAEWYGEALKLEERLARVGTDRIARRTNLLLTHNRLSELYLAAGKLVQSRQSFRKALEVGEPLANEVPGNTAVQHALWLTYTGLGDVSTDERQSRAAYEWYGKAVRISERLAKPESPEAQRDLWTSYKNLGDASADLGDRTKARAWHTKAVATAEPLVNANAEIRLDLSISYADLGNLERTAGNRTQAREWYAKALETVGPLAKGGNTEADKEVVKYRRALAELGSGR